MEEAAARRERLEALKQAAQLVDAGDGSAPAATAAAPPAAAEDSQEPSGKPVLKFRNYVVKDEKHIQHEKVRPWQTLVTSLCSPAAAACTGCTACATNLKLHAMLVNEQPSFVHAASSSAAAKASRARDWHQARRSR